MVPSRFEALGLNSTFEGIFTFKHVDRYGVQGCEVFRGMAFSHTAVVFSPGTAHVDRGLAVDAVVLAAKRFTIDGDCFTLEGR